MYFKRVFFRFLKTISVCRTADNSAHVDKNILKLNLNELFSQGLIFFSWICKMLKSYNF